MYRVNNLTVKYGGNVVLDNVSFSIEKGKWVQIKGLNGEGKTTLLKALYSIIPYKGSIYLDDKSLSLYSRKDLYTKVAYLPQSFDNIPRLKVIDFLSLYGDREKIKELSRLVGIDSLENIYLSDLSKGCLQLVFLTKVLLIDYKVLLLDEPTAFLDIEGKVKVYSLLHMLSTEGKTIITVSNDTNPYYNPQVFLTVSNHKVYDLNRMLVLDTVSKYKHNTPTRKTNKTNFICLLLMVLSLGWFIYTGQSLVCFTWLILSGALYSYIGFLLQLVYKNNLVSPITLGTVPIPAAFLSLSSVLSFGILSSFLLSVSSFLASVVCSFLLYKLPYLRSLGLVFSLFFILFWNKGYHINDSLVSFTIVPFLLFLTVLLNTEHTRIQLCMAESGLSLVNKRCSDLFLVKILGLISLIMCILILQVGSIFFVGLLIPNVIQHIYGDNIDKNKVVLFLTGATINLFLYLTFPSIKSLF